MNDDNLGRRGAVMSDRELHERGADGRASLTTRLWRSAMGWPGRQRLASWGARRDDLAFGSRQRGIPAQIIFFVSLLIAPGCLLQQEREAFSAQASQAEGAAKAFPTAEGFGANAKGGRGGAVYEIVNLNDSGAGSLRACVEATGPRTCVFRTGGTIELKSSLAIRNPYLTIAGQTAPGGGITLKNAIGMKAGTLVISDTHDVVIRYIRSRSGTGNVETSSIDPIQMLGSNYHIILDHVSASWGIDENFGHTTDGNSYDVTIQWSIFSEGLASPLHPKGPHSKGLLISLSGPRKDNNFTLHHNLFAHNKDRNPDLAFDGLADIVNNVFYNGGSAFGEFRLLYGNLRVNYVGNYVKRGPMTNSKAYEVDIRPHRPEWTGKLYVKDNIGPHRLQGTGPEESIVPPDDHAYLVSSRMSAPQVTTTRASKAYDEVLAKAGASLTRDVVDIRIVQSVGDGTGKFIADPSEVGGWPMLAQGTAPPDSDKDGMPNEWEVAKKLNPNDAADRNADADADGYTNLEEYLNELAGDTAPRGGGESGIQREPT